jgi:AMP deaminase
MGVTIHGNQIDELGKLARWFIVNDISSRRVSWLIEIPRLYSFYKQRGEVESMQDILRNIFEPII